jgi:DNA replicative helicase MCM subunit Mcm2 (Cdc46/Mcm family)
MTKTYNVILSYKQRKATMIKSIGEIDSSMIGSLVIVKGIVIRTDEVKPRLSIGTFTCDVCGCENYM